MVQGRTAPGAGGDTRTHTRTCARDACAWQALDEDELEALFNFVLDVPNHEHAEFLLRYGITTQTVRQPRPQHQRRSGVILARASRAPVFRLFC